MHRFAFILTRGQRLALRLRLNEAGPLVTLCVLSFFAWAFVKLAGAVVEGDTEAFDRRILLSLRNPADLSDPIGPSWFEEAARDVTGLGSHTILLLVTLASLAYLLLMRKCGAALLLLAAVGGVMLLSAALKLGFERPRPDLVPHGARVYTASFPSGHAMLSAATYLTLGALLARVHERRHTKVFFLSVAIVLTVLVGASRIYLGVHWPSDVLAGWCGGAAWAALCWFVALQLQRRGDVEPPS
ncbi:MAG TPA: phosphatase PAP2 family protein [Beijerinckiaceae bacterium]|jgi:undecaprenyl-diphosphatase